MLKHYNFVLTIFILTFCCIFLLIQGSIITTTKTSSLTKPPNNKTRNITSLNEDSSSSSSEEAPNNLTQKNLDVQLNNEELVPVSNIINGLNENEGKILQSSISKRSVNQLIGTKVKNNLTEVNFNQYQKGQKLISDETILNKNISETVKIINNNESKILSNNKSQSQFNKINISSKILEISSLSSEEDMSKSNESSNESTELLIKKVIKDLKKNKEINSDESVIVEIIEPKQYKKEHDKVSKDKSRPNEIAANKMLNLKNDELALINFIEPSKVDSINSEENNTQDSTQKTKTNKFVLTTRGYEIVKSTLKSIQTNKKNFDLSDENVKEFISIEEEAKSVETYKFTTNFSNIKTYNKNKVQPTNNSVESNKKKLNQRSILNNNYLKPNELFVPDNQNIKNLQLLSPLLPPLPPQAFQIIFIKNDQSTPKVSSQKLLVVNQIEAKKVYYSKNEQTLDCKYEDDVDCIKQDTLGLLIQYCHLTLLIIAVLLIVVVIYKLFIIAIKTSAVHCSRVRNNKQLNFGKKSMESSLPPIENKKKSESFNYQRF